MRKAAAYLGMLLIAGGLAGLDWLLLEYPSSYARSEIERMLGSSVAFRGVTASLGGVRIEGPELFTDGRLRPLEAERVEITLRGGRPDVVRLVAPKIHLSDKLIEELDRTPSTGSIRDKIKPEDLPRVVCDEARVETVFPEFFPQGLAEATVRGLALTPVGGYRYHVSARLEHPVYGDWRAEGEFDLDTKDYRFTLRAEGLRIGPEMAAPLGRDLRAIYEKYRPEGLCDLAFTFSRGGFRATLVARDMGILYKHFPYKAERASGEIDFFAKGFRIKHMTARHGDAVIRFDGEADDYPATAGYSFRIEIDRLALDEDVRNAIDEDGRRVWGLFRPAGRASVRGRVERDPGPDKPSRLPLELALEGASFTFKDFPYEVKNLAGEVRIDGQDVEVKRLVGREGARSIQLSGLIREIATDAVIDLSIEAQGLALDERLKAAIPADLQKTWEDFSPSGLIDVRWRLRKEKGKEPVHSAVARARGNSVTYREVPLPVTDVEGEVELDGPVIRLHHLTGKSRGAAVEAHGKVTPSGVSLHLDAVGMPLDDTVKGALPEKVGGLLKDLRLQGAINFSTNLELVNDGKKQVDLVLRISKGSVNTEPKLEDLVGDVVLTGFLEKEPTLIGFLNISRARIAGKRVTEVSSSFNVIGPRINFVNVKATAYGGLISARSFSIDTKTGEFAGEFNVDRLDIREYSLDTAGYSKKTLAGKASLELKELSGKAGESGSIVGKGQLTIRDGFLWDVPIFVSLFTLNPQDLFKAKNQFDSGIIDFDIKQRRFLIRGLVFSSESVSVLGKGAVDFDGNLDLILKTQTGFFGIDLPFIKIFTAIFDALKGAFHGVHVTGTFEKPETSQKLFPGSGEKE